MKQHRGYFRKSKTMGEWENISEPEKIESHFVITDETNPFESYADYNKRIFTSKSAYRKHLRSKGFYETGGEHLKEKPESEQEKNDRELRETVKDVEQSYFDVKYDRAQFTDREKENHLREQRRLGKAWALKTPY